MVRGVGFLNVTGDSAVCGFFSSAAKGKTSHMVPAVVVNETSISCATPALGSGDDCLDNITINGNGYLRLC